MKRGLNLLEGDRKVDMKLGVAKISMTAPGGSIGRSVKLAMDIIYRDVCRGLCSGTHLGMDRKRRAINWSIHGDGVSSEHLVHYAGELRTTQCSKVFSNDSTGRVPAWIDKTEDDIGRSCLKTSH